MHAPDTPLDVVLMPGRDRSVRRRHPWLLAGAVERADPEAVAGSLVRVMSADGEVLGHGHYAPASRLRVRLLCFGKEPPAADLLGERIRTAVARRAQEPALAQTDAVRLVNSEGDGLPGLVADRYGDLVVVRITAPGMAARRDEIAQVLREATGASAGIERSDDAAGRREGFTPGSGAIWGQLSSDPLWIREGSRRYRVDVAAGQKTGFYLDQRDARERVQGLAGGRRVLDLFAYTGGFGAAAARGGARHVTLVESSAAALALAGQNLAANGAQPGSFELVQGNAFDYLRGGGDAWDLIAIDPPPLARSHRDVDRAARAYKDLLLFALRRAAPGAFVLSFACSHHIDPELFRKIAFGASIDAERSAQVLATLEAPVDHPVSIDHLEGRYLTGLLLRT